MTLAERNLVEAAVAEATAELDNARLRADLALRLLEVQESRARIATSQVAERQRIERNLHDGAQQRLLALALQLRAAHANGDQARLQQTVQHGIGEIQVAIAELRELANGLHPSALSSAGLAGALDELASRSPIPGVIIADDSVLLREGLARILAEAQIEVTAMVGDAAALERAVEQDPPDAAVIGIRMPPTFTHEGAQAAIRLRERQPALGILLLSQSMETRYAAALARANPRGSDICSRTGSRASAHSSTRCTAWPAEVPCWTQP